MEKNTAGYRYNPEISVERKDALQAGGCNACSESRFSVWEVTLQNMAFRVCYDCKVRLEALLRLR